MLVGVGTVVTFLVGLVLGKNLYLPRGRMIPCEVSVVGASFEDGYSEVVLYES
jgi:hypothetical protein